MTITPASSTGSGETPSSSTTKPDITSEPKPPSTPPNRWGLRNLYSFYRHVCGTALNVIIGYSTAVRMWIPPSLPNGNVQVINLSSFCITIFLNQKRFVAMGSDWNLFHGLKNGPVIS